MIALGIRYLTGYSVSMDLSRQRAEWPPHPARLCMAMAAAFFEQLWNGWRHSPRRIFVLRLLSAGRRWKYTFP